MTIHRAFAFIARTLAIIAAIIMFQNTAAASTDKRVALVIGNSVYTNSVKLPNTLNDARLMSKTFRGAGFEVFEGLDLTKVQMTSLLDQFTEKAYGADLAVVYYAGHGMQVDGVNYLVPTDAVLKSPAHLKTRTFTLDDIIDTLPADPGVGFVILDACRNNPLALTLASMPISRSISVSSGLAPIQVSSSKSGTGGIIIAYATDPGAIALDGKGKNSPYTLALAKHLTTPGLELQVALTRVRGDVTEFTKGAQRPWHNASIGREIYLGGKPAVSTLAILPGDDEETTASTAGSVKTTQWAVETQFWQEVTKRDTIPHYQAYLKQFPNGRFISVAQLNISGIEIEIQRKADVKAAEEAKADVQIASLETSSQSRAIFNIPDAVKSASGTVETDKALALNKKGRIDLQLRLAAIGHYNGRIDGSIGPLSRGAITEWQNKYQIVATSYLTAEQWDYLKLESEPQMAALYLERKQQAKAAAARARKAAKRKTAKRRTAARRNVSHRDTRAAREASYYEKREERRRRSRDNAVGALAVGITFGVIGCKLTGGC